MEKLSASIKKGTYENIYVDCPYCGNELIFNRISDLGTSRPIAGKELKCYQCGDIFWTLNDRVETSDYKWFIRELDKIKDDKNYRAYVMNLYQGLEAFFHQAIINKKFDRNPDFRNYGYIIRKKYNDEREKYYNKTKKWAFNKMRSEFLESFKEERNNYIPQGSKPREDKRIKCFELIEKTKINELRNKVVHKYAYRPSLKEINEYDNLVNAIYWLGLYLDVKDSILLVNKPI